MVVGNRRFVAPSPELEAAADALEGAGRTVVFVGWDGQARGLLALADTVRPGARAAVADLTAMGVEVAMVTGDNARTAAAIGTELGITRVMAGVLPAAKADEIARLQADGRVVAMVGDGVNDAPALARADLGIAIGTGADVAIETSAITLLSSDVAGVATAIRLSRATYTTILQNLGWAFGYNLVAIPLAAFGLLTPVVAGAAMGLSSVSVVANSLRLYRFSRKPTVAPTKPASAHRRRAGLALAWTVPAVALVAVVLATRPSGSGAEPVDRVVEMAMSEYAYGPASISVAAGQEVRFVFRNDGSVPHEAVIGDDDVQSEAGHADHDAHGAASVQVQPGGTASLVYRFDEPGDVLIGCHIPGHYESGMQAVVHVTS